MNRNGWVSFLFVVLGLIMIYGTSYFVLSEEGGKLSFLMPVAALSLSIPVLLVFLSMIMFVAGFYYQKARHDKNDMKESTADIELVRNLVTKIEKEKNSADEKQ